MTSKVVSYKELFAEFISASDLLESKIVEQLHEEIGSDLMALKLKLSASNLIDEIKIDADEKINSLLVKIKSLSDQLYPIALDELGLLGALKSTLRRFNHFSNVSSVELKQNKPGELLVSIEKQRQLYYIIEEILIKLIEDSKQNKIRIAITENDKLIEILIADDNDLSCKLLSNENFVADLGIQKMHSRLNKINAQISCERLNNSQIIKITARNEKRDS